MRECGLALVIQQGGALGHLVVLAGVAVHPEKRRRELVIVTSNVSYAMIGSQIEPKFRLRPKTHLSHDSRNTVFSRLLSVAFRFDMRRVVLTSVQVVGRCRSSGRCPASHTALMHPLLMAFFNLQSAVTEVTLQWQLAESSQGETRWVTCRGRASNHRVVGA
jgi:hypothetical protein